MRAGLIGLFFLLLISGIANAQCAVDGAAGAQNSSQVQQLFEQKQWDEVVRVASAQTERTADENFDLGLAFAHLQQWPEARAALLAGERECPEQERFAVELAGIAFEQKHYSEAATWLRRSLKLDEKDEYSNDFAGTVYLLMGNVNAALKYWNRVKKPYVEGVAFDPQLKVQRLILDRAVAFSPEAVLAGRDYETTEERVNGLGIFSSHNVLLSARPDGKFDVEFHAVERDGFGSSWPAALLSIFRGAAYETIYPSYWNIGGSAMNVESLLRIDAQKRRAWVSVSAPLHERPEWRWKLQADGRNENWAVREGSAPVLGSLNMEREVAAASFTSLRSGRFQWATGAELSNRRYRNVAYGSALTPGLVVPGFELKYFLSTGGTVWEIPERRFKVTADARPEIARFWATGPRVPGAPSLFGRVQESGRMSWFPQAQGENYELDQQVRAGQTVGNGPFDELYLLGMERDTDLWLRGQNGTRDGKKGSSPLASNFFLSNTDFLRRIYGNGLLTIKAGPLLDIAKTRAPTGGLARGGWIYDVGAEARFTVLGTSVIVTYGRDLRTGNNAVFGTASP